MVLLNLLTKVKLPSSSFTLNFEDTICLIGSCFSNHLSNYLQQSLLTVDSNPCGITFNPHSICSQIQNILAENILEEDAVIFSDGLYHSLNHHGSFSASSKEVLFENIKKAQQSFRLSIQKAKVLIVTLGTANIFRYKKTGKVVNNCHKLPNSQFHRERLLVDDIIDQFTKTIQQCRSINPELNVVLTISPIRHIRDGLIENQRSKSTLVLATDQLQRKIEGIDYFPAYEICLDELRDYRFYTHDLIHPNQQAVDYILNSFITNYFDAPSLEYLKEINQLQKSVNHKPLHPKSSQYQNFVKDLSSKIEILQNKYPTRSIADLQP